MQAASYEIILAAIGLIIDHTHDCSLFGAEVT